MPGARILVALSGGVDSSVAALLLREQGFDVSCAYIRVWMHEDEVFGRCPAGQDIEDARAVAALLGLPFEVVNLAREYRERVVDYLVEGYRQGVTPNPDMLCNREIKFGVFLQWALAQGFDGIATGHYVRRLDRPDGSVDLAEGLDPNKDQSYFLALLSPEQIRRAWFPLGELAKPHVRALARRHAFPNAAKRDSQGICFLGEVRINDFLAGFIPETPGPIVNPAGQVLGRHRGLHRYTLGQRRGIGIPSNTDHRAYVVVGKDFATHTLRVAFDEPAAPGLYQDTFLLARLSSTGLPLAAPTTLLARPRYRDPATPVDLLPGPAPGLFRVRFHQPQRALAPGQVIAFYHGDLLRGGAFFL